jgi:hypothetical protein
LFVGIEKENSFKKPIALKEIEISNDQKTRKDFPEL